MSPRGKSWVVCTLILPNSTVQATLVLETREWEARERKSPGHVTLVHRDIPTEGEAERLARAAVQKPRPTAVSAGVDRFPPPVAALRPEAEAYPIPVESPSPPLPLAV
jgi:hypothetical protein